MDEQQKKNILDAFQNYQQYMKDNPLTNSGATDNTNSGQWGYYYPYYSRCPGCGRCGVCGRSAEPYYPFTVTC